MTTDFIRRSVRLCFILRIKMEIEVSNGSLLRGRIDPEFEKMWDRLYKESKAKQKSQQILEEAGLLATSQITVVEFVPTQEELF